MAVASLVLSDDSTLSKVDHSLLRLERFFALISGLAVFSLMLLAVVSVGGRNLFNSPLPGYVDWIEQAMPLIAFMGISYVMREGAHIRMDIVVGTLRGRPLYIVELITTLAAPMWSRDSSMDIALPIWPAKLMAPLAFGVLCLRLCLQVWAYGRAIKTGQAIAVPMVADAAKQAQMEADQLKDQI